MPSPELSPLKGRGRDLLHTCYPIVRGEDERDRAVVSDAHPHLSSKAPRPRLYSALTKTRYEDLVELLRPQRVACFQQARPAATAHVGEKRELRHDQCRSLHVDKAQVHLACFVREDSQVDELVRQAPHVGFVVIGCRTNPQHITVSDGCMPTVFFIFLAPRARSDALRDDSQTFGPNSGSA